MATGTLIPVEEYLRTSYRPDREYLEGEVLERNLGERDHSRLQILLGSFLNVRESEWGIQAFTEQRVQVKPNRFRIPDLCVVLGSTEEKIFRTPPFLCIEILSPEDTVTSMQSRIDDYLSFGVRFVWLIDPVARRAWVYTNEGMKEAKDGILTTQSPTIAVPLPELFARW
jgi:Uma2 family endonuclease